MNHAAPVQLLTLEQGYQALVFDAPGAVNLLSQATLTVLEDYLHRLSACPPRGLLLYSKKAHFILGADIKEFLPAFAGPHHLLVQWLVQARTLFNQLEDLPCPTLALLQGHVLGGGAELALACDYRLAAPDTLMGLPETRLGLLPGFGGCVRLPRLIGLDAALAWILEGTPRPATQLLGEGAVDGICPIPTLLPAGLTLLGRANSGELDWQARRPIRRQPLALPVSEQQLTLRLARQRLALAPAQGEAPTQALEALAESLNQPRAAAQQTEQDHFLRLCRRPQTRHLIQHFLCQQAHHRRPTQANTVPSLGLVGGGAMGLALAEKALAQGLRVQLYEAEPRQRAALPELLATRWQGLSTADQASRWQQLRLLEQPAQLAGCQLVLEAIAEDLAAKQALWHTLEPFLPAQALLLSTTASLGIAPQACGLRHPERLAGLHFCEPESPHSLVELVFHAALPETQRQQVAELARQLGRMPIQVADGPGFLVNRLLFAYLAAFLELVAGGISPYQLDDLMTRQFGWPQGPARLLDDMGLANARRIMQQLSRGISARFTPPQSDPLSTLLQAGRDGCHQGAGFYRYVHGHAKTDPAWAADGDNLPTEAALCVQLLLPLLEEAALCLEEKVVAGPAELDEAMRLGAGFPAFRGGPCAYLDDYGLARLLGEAEALALPHPRHRHPALSRRLALAEPRYYPEVS